MSWLFILYCSLMCSTLTILTSLYSSSSRADSDPRAFSMTLPSAWKALSLDIFLADFLYYFSSLLSLLDKACPDHSILYYNLSSSLPSLHLIYFLYIIAHIISYELNCVLTKRVIC